METTEEPIGGLSLLAYRRVSTMIGLARVRPGVGAGRTIEPLDLDAALKRDAAKGALPERADRSDAP